MRAPDGHFPAEVAQRLWHEYERAEEAEIGAAASPELAEVAAAMPHAVTATLTPAELHRVLFFVTVAQLGLDLPTLKAEAAGLSDAIGDLSSTEPDVLAGSSPIPLKKVLARAAELRAKCTPLHERWFARLLAIPNGPKRLITMRAEMLRLQTRLAQIADRDAMTQEQRDATRAVAERMRPVEASLTAVLREWASTAWLVIDEMTWTKTPALVIEQVMNHEAVHRFANLEDVKRRMQPSPYRCAFAFFHPAFVAEPLTMVVVALTRGIADNVDTILEHGGTSKRLDFAGVPHSHPLVSASESTPELPDSAGYDTAIFYSITSTQKGLQGIELGNHLIKMAVQQLQSTRPHVKQFCTLSPIPGWGAWLQRRISERSRDPASVCSSGGVDGQITAALADLFGIQAGCEEFASFDVDDLLCELERCGAIRHGASPFEIAPAICKMLRDDMIVRPVAGTSQDPRPWWSDARLARALQPLLMGSVRCYLTGVTRRGRAYDPVANFHLRNGATLFRLNWLANCTGAASKASACVMVNYHYELATVERNARQYAESGTIAQTNYSNVGGPSRRVGGASP